MRRALTAVLTAAALALAGASAAQPAGSAPGTTVKELTVQGQKGAAPPPSFKSAASSYVRAHAQESYGGGLSRFLEPVCPLTIGLTPAFDDFVSRRIGEIAVRVGARRPKACPDANVLVAVTPDPQQLVDRLSDKHPQILGYHFVPEEKALKTFKGPIQAWHMTGTRDLNGTVYVDDPYVSLDNPAMRGPKGWANSRLRHGMASAIVFALVVVDQNRIEDLPIGAVADHVAALALSKPSRRRGCSPLPSITDALDPACPDSAGLETLTDYDEAFLKGLYATDPEEYPSLEQGSILLKVLKDTRPPGK